MSRLARVGVCLGVVLVVVATLSAQGDVSRTRPGAERLPARRAARVDAIRKLTEEVKRLNIAPQMTVADFVAGSDRIGTSLMALLNGTPEKKAAYAGDGTCDVTMELAVRDVIANLLDSHRQYYKGDKVKAPDFEKMLTAYQGKVLTEFGTGAPRGEEWEQQGPMVPLDEGAEPRPGKASAAAGEFWAKYCTSQGHLLAVKAARADALRRLTERVKGVYVTSRVTVADLATDSDQPDVNMLTFVVPRETAVRYHDDDLIVELEMSVKLRTLYGSIRNWAEGHYKGTKVKISDFEELILKSQDMAIKAPGVGVPPEEGLLANAPAEVASLVRMVGGRPPEWLSMRLEATGTAAVDAANPDRGQAELMAYRAAEIDARRKLAERINGLMVTSSLSVRDFASRNDAIARAMLTFQQTPQEVADARKLMPDGKVETRMAVELRPLWDMIVHYQKKR